MNETFQISFPGLGIDEFTLNRIAFSIGSLEVRWYGIVITLGIALAFWYAYFRGKRNEGVVLDDIIDIGLFTVPLGILGARLYYVLTTLDTGNYKNFIDVIAIWNGGLAIYGGIIGGCAGILLACKIKKIRWQKVFDMVAPGVMIAQALGRWGNFFNGEAYGYAVGDTTRFYFFNTEHVLNSGEGTFFHTLRMGLGGSAVHVYYQPTFFYESMWNVLGFVLINLFYKRKKFDGQIALLYFVWYGFGRMFIEGFRTDSLYIPGTTLRISQCLGLACFLVGVILLIAVPLYKKHRPTLAAAEGETVVGTEASMDMAGEDTSEIVADAEGNKDNNNDNETNEETGNNEDGKID